MVSMSANQASIRAEIFERLDAYLDKSRREGTLKSNELYELVRLTTAFGVDGLPDDVPQDVAVRHILETELPPLPDPHTHTRDDVNHRRENDGRRKTTTANDERRFVNDDDETEHMFLPTQAAIASTPGRRAMNNNGGGFDVYERGVDAIHAATARWSQSPPPYRHRDHDHHRRLREEESEERLPRTRTDSRQSTSPYSPAFAAGLRAASAPRARATRGASDVSPSPGSGRYHRDDADAAYVNRLRRNKSSSMDRTFSGRDSGYSSIGPSSTRRHHDAAHERRPAWGGSGRVAPGSAERASHSTSALRRLADPEVASAKAERAAAVAAAAERKAVERMAAARAKQKGKGGQSKGAAWQPPRKPSDAARPKPFGLTLTPPRDVGGKNISQKYSHRSPTPPPTNTSFSPGSSGRARWTESDKVEDRLRRDWVLREARREARHVETMELEKSKTRKTLLETNPFAVNHPVNVPASRTEAHGRHLHARGMQRAARITESHVTSPSTLRAGMSPVGMGGEESVRPRGMTNVSRVLMSDQPDDFLTRQEAANRRREAKVLEERARLEAETAEKEAAAMRTTPKITDAAKGMRRTVDDLRAWQDRKNASVRELQRRREEYEDRVVNTFTPRLSKGSRAIERGKKKIVVHSPGGKKHVQSFDGGRDSETLVDARLRMAHSGVGGVQDAFSPEPEMRRPETAPQPTPMTKYPGGASNNSNSNTGADAMAAVLAGAAMAGAAALAARTGGVVPSVPGSAAANVRANVPPSPARSDYSSEVAASGNFSVRGSMSIRNSVHVPRAAAGHYNKNTAVRPPSAMTLDDERSTTFAPAITSRARNLRRSGDFGERMYAAAMESSEKRRGGPRVGSARDSNRGPGGSGTWGLYGGSYDELLVKTPVAVKPKQTFPRGSPGSGAKKNQSTSERRPRQSTATLQALRRSSSKGESSPGPRGRSRATRRLNHGASSAGEATGTEAEREYWTAAGEDSGAEFGSLGEDPDAFVASAKRGQEADAAWGYVLSEGA